MKAPIQLHVLAKLLGEARADAFTLCSSPNINPYSLIKPTYVESKTFSHVGKGPEDLAGDSWPDLPAAVKKGHGIVDGDSHTWVKCRYGYHVPCCTGSFNGLLDIKDTPWVHVGCEAADKARNGGVASWAQLVMFDGYLHDASPVSPITSVRAVVGKPIAISLAVGARHTAVNADGSYGNPGGTVSIPDIIGTSTAARRRIIGASVYIKDGQRWLIRKRVAGFEVPDSKEMVPYEAIDTGVEATSGQSYLIVPWLLEGGKAIADLARDDTGVVPAAGDRIFPLRFDARHESSFECTISDYHPVISNFTFRSNGMNLMCEVTLKGVDDTDAPVFSCGSFTVTVSANGRIEEYQPYRSAPYATVGPGEEVTVSFRINLSEAQQGAGFIRGTAHCTVYGDDLFSKIASPTFQVGTPPTVKPTE